MYFFVFIFVYIQIYGLYLSTFFKINSSIFCYYCAKLNGKKTLIAVRSGVHLN